MTNNPHNIDVHEKMGDTCCKEGYLDAYFFGSICPGHAGTSNIKILDFVSSRQ